VAETCGKHALSGGLTNNLQRVTFKILYYTYIPNVPDTEQFINPAGSES
jgi:hypothetical protein